MNFYKGLYLLHVYNVGFMGGGRCGVISIDGHYSFITDFKEFIIWQFGTYANLVSIQDKYVEPELTDIEAQFCNDILYDQICRDMSNSINPNCTDISKPLWDNIYGEDRTMMHDQWTKLKHYKFYKHYISPNVHSGDTVKDSETGEEFKVTYMHDLRYIGMNEKYIITKRYDYFPELLNKQLVK